MKEVTPKELKALKEGNNKYQLIDVREPDEYQFVNIDGKLIPMGEIPVRIAEIEREGKVVIMCRSGKRSGNIIKYLEATHGFENLYNLRGGILGYAVEVDPSLPSY